MFYEKTDAGAPPTPEVAVYNFSSGDITDGGTGTDRVLDSGTTNVWRNSPNTQNATSSNIFWTIRYFGTEASADASNITVTYSNIVQHTSFSGVVTFSGGTFSEVGGSTVYDTTTIDGGHITTGTIAAGRISTDLLRVTGDAMTGGTVGGWTIDSSSIYSGSKDLSGFTSNGAITLSSTGEIHTPTFYVESDGTSGFKGTVTISGTDLTSGNTLNGNTVGGDLCREFSALSFETIIKFSKNVKVPNVHKNRVPLNHHKHS